MQATCSNCSQAFQLQAGPCLPWTFSPVCWHQKSLSIQLSFPTLTTFRKFFSLSPTEDIHHSPQQRRGSHNSFLGFIKYVQEPICSCHRETKGRQGALSAVQPESQPLGWGPPSTNVSLKQAELKGHPRPNAVGSTLKQTMRWPQGLS